MGRRDRIWLPEKQKKKCLGDLGLQIGFLREEVLPTRAPARTSAAPQGFCCTLWPTGCTRLIFSFPNLAGYILVPAVQRQTPAFACKWDIHEEKGKTKDGKLWFQRQARFEVWKFWAGWRWGSSSASCPVPQSMGTMVREQKQEMPDTKLRNPGLVFSP